MVLLFFSDKATNAGQMVGVDVQFDNAGFYVVDQICNRNKRQSYVGYFGRFSRNAVQSYTFAGRFNTV